MGKIYYFTDTNSSDVTDGTDFNKTAEETAPASETTHSKNNVGGGDTDIVTHTYTNLDNVPGLTEWPSGDYIARANCSFLDADVTFKLAICRVDNTGALVSTLGTSGVFSTTGYKTFTHNLASPLTVNAGDRLQVRMLVSRSANHGNQQIDFTVGTASSESQIETPIVDTVTTTQTITGVARIQKTVNQTITGVSRIQQTVNQTLTGQARIEQTTTQTLTGKAAIKKTATQTITGKAAIKKTTTQTLTGVANIVVAVNQDITGVARIQKTVNQNITGVSRIQQTANQTITGVANIVVAVDQTITGKARIENTATQTITGISRIQKTVNQTLSGVSRIQQTVNQTIAGVANIVTTATQQTITGVASILKTQTQTLTGKANIVLSGPTVPQTIETFTSGVIVTAPGTDMFYVDIKKPKERNGYIELKVLEGQFYFNVIGDADAGVAARYGVGEKVRLFLTNNYKISCIASSSNDRVRITVY